ncbi:putative lipid II flippase FtsW [Natronospira bacteriovora]|uniref:Probable peptidoglycan glycosyltransferase FtsW n=1 Tax=Natronospira bacteriovora TaxID=3069753 RepID=A0ABU0W653_9GAMM|nr:putative lipid II flippase FtsW [Natronospira sp. AB-CW4]MDQ2069507.1 putative lipid II flippase FtsW [Natronospira sp. AB-CW4]
MSQVALERPIDSRWWRQLAHGVDWPLLIVTLALLTLGLVAVASSSISIADRALGDPFHYLRRQAMFLGLALVAAFMTCQIPLRVWQQTSFLLLLFALFLLLLVLVPGVGKEVNGAVRWIAIGPFHLQVSEPARLLLILYVAAYMVRRQEELATRFSGFLKPVLVAGLAVFLLLLQPDFGAAIVLLITILAMLFLGGVRIRDFSLLGGVGAMAMAGLAFSSPYRVERLTTFLNPWADPFNSGFQLTQSLIAIGRGEWFGVGLGSSVQKLFYLPESHTDFIFAVLFEELGLLGVLVLIGLFAFLVWRCFLIGTRAWLSGHAFGAYVAWGVSVWLGIQATINMGVNMGLLPTKGLTLPLISYGGSSLLVTLGALALVLRVSREITPVSNLRREVKA